MSWEMRQKRLKALFGARNSLCLQVFCEFYRRGISLERFGELVEQHGYTTLDLATVRNLPKPKIGEIEFRSGHVFIDRDGIPTGSEVFVQPIFTSTDRDLIRHVQASYEGDDYVCLSNPILDNIMARYIPGIEEQLPQLNFEGRRYADIGSVSIEFKFGIQPYNFDLHPPHDMDVLKPINIIKGYIIHPSTKDSFDIVSILRQPSSYKESNELQP